jgi:CRISPR/Cas system-associated protein Cas7 (RAMP superfamily)
MGIDQEAIKVVNHPDTEDSAANKSEKLENVLTNLGISTDAAHHCAQSVFAGATLVIVKASAQAAAGVRAILQQAGTLNYEPP